ELGERADNVGIEQASVNVRRGFPGKQAIEGCAERINVSPRVGASDFVGILFEGSVFGRAETTHREGSGLAGRVIELDEPEIYQHDFLLRREDEIVGLDVAVNQI